MSKNYISALLRQQVRTRAGFRCEYCLVHEDDVLLPYHIDHIIAEQHGGKTTLINLANSCIHCNRAKGPNIASFDSLSGAIVPLFNPRTSQWQDHFRLERGQILPLTDIARATVQLLQLNHPERVRVRQALIAIGRYP